MSIEADGRIRTLDTHAETAGEIELDLPPPDRVAGQRLDLPPYRLMLSGLLGAVILAVLLRLSSRRAAS